MFGISNQFRDEQRCVHHTSSGRTKKLHMGKSVAVDFWCAEIFTSL
jgi:hypothetical protein